MRHWLLLMGHGLRLMRHGLLLMRRHRLLLMRRHGLLQVRHWCGLRSKLWARRRRLLRPGLLLTTIRRAPHGAATWMLMRRNSHMLLVLMSKHWMDARDRSAIVVQRLTWRSHLRRRGHAAIRSSLTPRSRRILLLPSMR